MSASLKTCFGFYGAAAIVGLFFTYLQMSPISSTPFVAYMQVSSPTYAFCGNGIVDPGEECDYFGIDGSYSYGSICNGNTGLALQLHVQCKRARCGDGYLNWTANETCDDGNTVDGDGCSATCQYLWPSFSSSSYSSLFFSLSSQPPICGNGIIETGESCDDGNVATGDGCSGCRVEGSCQCTGQPSACACWTPSSSSIGLSSLSSKSSLSPPSLWWGWWLERVSSVSSTSSSSSISSAKNSSSSLPPSTSSSVPSSHPSGSSVPASSVSSAASSTSSLAPICGNRTLERGEKCESWKVGENLTLIQGCGFGSYCLDCQKCGTAVCGDKVVSTPVEKCDPPGASGGTCSVDQTCDNECKRCIGGSSSSVSTTCGNGTIEDGEACDWVSVGVSIGCPQLRPYCTQCKECGLCGNGTINAGEKCDPPGGVCEGNGICGSQCEICTHASSSQIRIGYVGVAEKPSILIRTLQFFKDLGSFFGD